MTASPSFDLHEASRRFPERQAVVDEDGRSVTYRELDALVTSGHAALCAHGVKAGDRVGIGLPKSIDAVAAIHAALRAGAVVVPIDPGSPASRTAWLLGHCDVRLHIAHRTAASRLLAAFGEGMTKPVIAALPDHTGGRAFSAWAGATAGIGRAPAQPVAVSPDSHAYLLYTSGSTGEPKGVVHSHGALAHFISWFCSEFDPTPEDRFSAHPPFHFALSVSDLFAPPRVGATIVLIGEESARNPQRLASRIDEHGITCWLSTPTALMALEAHGRLERHSGRSIRQLLFAGEVYPVQRLRRLMHRWSAPRYINVYGSTETNMRAIYEAPKNIPPDRTAPLPLGRPCNDYHFSLRGNDGAGEAAGIGELVVSGPSLMAGFWRRPDLDARSLLTDRDGTRWFCTGDIVRESPDGTFVFAGRRDRMVKRRGVRIELGEIDACLSLHPQVAAVASVAVPAEADGVRIQVFVVSQAGAGPSVIDLMRFCVERLPAGMVPDAVAFVPEIPVTSTGKIDYPVLTSRAAAMPSNDV
jgi:amino acid adenylation domain-containing protein